MCTLPRMNQLGRIAWVLALLASGGCGTSSGTSDRKDSVPEGPSTEVAAREAIPTELAAELEVAQSLDGDGLLAAYPGVATAAPSYDPSAAIGLELITNSNLGLNEQELGVLKAQGLVISQRVSFASFPYGYKSIYADDLPVYVSADSILDAVHHSFDEILKQTEELVLTGELTSMLDGMRRRLASVDWDAGVVSDADLYLTVAQSLLTGQALPPAASAEPSQISKLFNLAVEAKAHETVKLFGVSRDEDFSQFEPRGHYTDSVTLGRYFKAMMWLGRVDVRLIETQSDGSQLFYRSQFDAAVALRELLGEPEYAKWQGIDQTIGAFVGEHDSMTPRDMDGLMAALGVTSLAEASGLSDQRIIDELYEGGWGAQRIASRLITVDAQRTEPLPLDRSFLLFGQRYTVDSHTFTNVTFDRVVGRLMPKPLDVAFAALGNDLALPYLAPEFENESYVHGLASTRTLVDAHDTAYWEGSAYTQWLGALRSLSPATGSELPSSFQTPAFQTRILGTQLGSWAELRHDTILYAKQSYTAGLSCEFPDAYVDPYPELYSRLGRLAEKIRATVDALPQSASRLKTQTQAWATNFAAVTGKLQQMAENQLTGAAHSQELLDFVNDAVQWDEEEMCGGVVRSNLAGWYLNLFLGPEAGMEYDPTVADVHTQPTDEAGNDVGRILHVGTGGPRLMVMTVETCSGPRAYAGVVTSYGELTRDNWERLNDDQWSQVIANGRFPDPPWMVPLLAE